MTLFEGIDLISRQIAALLEKYNVKPMEVLGKTFDPNIHEAVVRVPNSGEPEYTIVGDLQRGYLIGDALLRPAKVAVAVTEE